jgi:hypothetical protein
LSNITFLPMIDLNPSDMSCLYSTLKFVSKEASHHNRTPVITFDQPLYWKALIISCDEVCSSFVWLVPNSSCHQTVYYNVNEHEPL